MLQDGPHPASPLAAPRRLGEGRGPSPPMSPGRTAQRSPNPFSTARRPHLEPPTQMLAHPQRVRDDGQGWVDPGVRGEEARIDHVPVVEIVSFTVRVQHRGARLCAEPARTGLTDHPRHRDLLGEVDELRDKVGHPALALRQRLAQLPLGRVPQHAAPGGGDLHAVVGRGQVLGRNPLIDRVVVMNSLSRNVTDRPCPGPSPMPPRSL